MIFGSQAPQFKNTAKTQTVNLDHAIMDPNWFSVREIEHESVINAHREFYKVANPHAEFAVTIHLFKYDFPNSKFDEIYPYLHQDVYFYPHRDGGPLNDANGTEILFHITDMQAIYLEQPSYYDVLIISFKSKDPISFSESFTSILTQNDGTVIQTGDGKNIKIKPGRELTEEVITTDAVTGDQSQETV